MARRRPAPVAPDVDALTDLLEEVRLDRPVRVCLLGVPLVTARLIGLTKQPPSTTGPLRLLPQRPNTAAPVWLIAVPDPAPVTPPQPTKTRKRGSR